MKKLEILEGAGIDEAIVRREVYPQKAVNHTIVVQIVGIAEGDIEITDETGVQLSLLGPRNSFGERALLRNERASRSAHVTGDGATLIARPRHRSGTRQP